MWGINYRKIIPQQNWCWYFSGDIFKCFFFGKGMFCIWFKYYWSIFLFSNWHWFIDSKLMLIFCCRTGDTPLQGRHNDRKLFPFDDVIMVLAWTNNNQAHWRKYAPFNIDELSDFSGLGISSFGLVSSCRLKYFNVLYSSNISEILLYNRQLFVIMCELIYFVQAAHR